MSIDVMSIILSIILISYFSFRFLNGIAGNEKYKLSFDNFELGYIDLDNKVTRLETNIICDIKENREIKKLTENITDDMRIEAYKKNMILVSEKGNDIADEDKQAQKEADEGEIPAEAEQHQVGPEMRHRDAGEADRIRDDRLPAADQIGRNGAVADMRARGARAGGVLALVVCRARTHVRIGHEVCQFIQPDVAAVIRRAGRVLRAEGRSADAGNGRNLAVIRRAGVVGRRAVRVEVGARGDRIAGCRGVSHGLDRSIGRIVFFRLAVRDHDDVVLLAVGRARHVRVVQHWRVV